MFKKFLIFIFLFLITIVAVNFDIIQDLAQCGNGDTQTCLNQGKVYLSKSESTMNLFIGISLLKKGCELDSAETCAHLGKFAMMKEGTINEAIVYLSKSCKLKSKKGCFGLGMVYEEVLKDKEKAQDAYKNSCRFGFKKACDINLEI